jgi:hypothetical protein
MTSGLRKDDSNKMNENKGQQVRVMQPVGDRVIIKDYYSMDKILFNKLNIIDFSATQ